MLFEPDPSESGPAPLVVMLHGCNQGAREFASSTLMNQAAAEVGAFVLYPEQAFSANILRCWNWFANQDRKKYEGDGARIVALVRQVVREHRIDPKRVYVAGLSAGGAMAAVIGRDYPDVFAALGVHSGVPAGIAHDLLSALRLMSRGPRTGELGATALNGTGAPTIASIVFHGDRDGTVNPSNGAAIHTAPGGGRLRWFRRRPRKAVTQPNGSHHGFTRSVTYGANDVTERELWIIHGAGHAWAGGQKWRKFADSDGPDASREMVRFFLQHRLAAGPALAGEMAQGT
jgi:poly(hydroxyalkanoate) depolymerase family esterase